MKCKVCVIVQKQDQQKCRLSRWGLAGIKKVRMLLLMIELTTVTIFTYTESRQQVMKLFFSRKVRTTLSNYKMECYRNVLRTQRNILLHIQKVFFIATSFEPLPRNSGIQFKL